MRKHRDALITCAICLLVAMPAFGQSATPGTGTPPPEPLPLGTTPPPNPPPHAATYPQNDPRRQREESMEADRIRKSGELGYQRDSASPEPASQGQNTTSPDRSKTGSSK